MAFGNKVKQPSIKEVIRDLEPFNAQDHTGYSEDFQTNLPAKVDVDLKLLEFQTVNDKLAQIAGLVRSLTYGEMKQLADELRKADEGKLIKPDHTFPDLLHRWSEGKKDTAVAVA